MSLYKTDTLIVRGLISAIDGGKRSASLAGCYPPGERAIRIHWIGDFVGHLDSLDYKEMRRLYCYCLESNHGSWVV